MLVCLSIKNFALIEDLNLDFTKGFTTITGETGAGKSILLKSIELLTGARADTSFVRFGCLTCVISASFEFKNEKISKFLDSLGISHEDNTIIIRRTIENSSKSKAFINDCPVNLNSLSKIGKLLIDFHAQDEKHSLLDNEIQMMILDKEIPEISSLLNSSQELYKNVCDLKSKISSINLSDEERERKIDLLSFQLKEIEDANLKVGEDEILEESLPQLKNAEKISQLCEETISLLYSQENAALNNIQKAKKNIESINSFGANASQALNLIEQSYYQADEAYREIESILSKVDLDPKKLNDALERAETIKKLKRKYGRTIEEILKYASSIEIELKSLNEYKENTDKLENDLKIQEEKLNEICKKITQKRLKAAQTFSRKVKDNLLELAINNAVFDIKLTPKEPSSTGADNIDFMFCANKGEKILPLKDCASGGELSRVLLAIELSSKLNTDQTTIFDEIDSGTGGRTGENIGKKLEELSKKKQVFSITHLAQVCAFADTHIQIYKETIEQRTYTKARILSQEEHTKEIARMISGQNITESAIKHATDLIKTSKNK